MPLGYPAAFSGMGPADISFSITSRPAVSIGDVASVRPLVWFLRHHDGPRRSEPGDAFDRPGDDRGQPTDTTTALAAPTGYRHVGALGNHQGQGRQRQEGKNEVQDSARDPILRARRGYRGTCGLLAKGVTPGALASPATMTARAVDAVLERSVTLSVTPAHRGRNLDRFRAR